MRQSVTVRAPAKVNLQLAVGPLREDGYHDLATVFHAVGLYDDVIAEPAEDIAVTLAEPDPEVPLDEGNLAVRAANALAEATGIAEGVHLRLVKRIPVAAGLAGGSADAAATLVACDALWGTALSREELAGIAATLGSDVPFALLGGTAIGTGRGTLLSPVLGRGEFHWVLAVAAEGLSTPTVYAECDRLRHAAGVEVPEPAVDDALMAALRSGDAKALGAALSNDLQDAAVGLRPALAQTLGAAAELGALGAIVSGSGPTVAFLVRSPEAAIDVAVGLTAMGLCRDVKRAGGPVPGAKVLRT
ncbi:4-(cytidine 5'-diphospho)-2-C-methyl-D-erythritol kinase [Sporichthya polymorpha]|uniref:4-(cytidine 5'-diphospho)-2-C-methyl-D-erythritol kinase n=1 Tax=Sporichthya polymorpha TaxID=35751 RepID=UPI00037A8AD5|nr:4-(cytidine 5'-diphospho)-2-C-methyl-D-erythritol kinase [Sporichthya polymorpha]